MPARTAFSLDDLSTNIPKIFEQVQNTTANHQKNYVALYKLHCEAAKEVESVQNGSSVKLIGERAFEDTLITMLSRVLPVKRGASTVDRVIRFIGGYVKFVNEKALEERQRNGTEDDDTASRFVLRVLRFLLKGCLAKDKNVRYRVVQCISEMIAYLGEIDEDAYTALREILQERLNDREPLVRVQTVIALSKLCGSEDPSEETTITDMLIDTLTYDISADVRRAALVNLPINEQTLPVILSRTRDVDPTVRKLVYSSVLEHHCFVQDPNGQKNEDDADEIGVTHPRVLSIANRELIVRNGLGDREESVKAAAIKLLETWLDVVSVKGEDGKNAAEASIVGFLDLFDLVANSTAEDALTSVFSRRTDLLDALKFEDAFWNDLTPSRAFLARVFVDYCVAHDDNVRLENALPVVTALAFRIQAAYNELLQELQEEEEELVLRGSVPEEREEARMEREFIIGEILRLAVNLDYADEIGRRKMFQLVRNMISQNILPEGLVARCLDVLRKLSTNERDLIRVVVEVVHELRDNSDDDDLAKDTSGTENGDTSVPATPMTEKTARPPRNAEAEVSPEDQARLDAIDMRCLSLCIGMLERVHGTFEENSTLEGLLGELVIPAVKRKELPIREKGLISLGLCCLIARRMAVNSFLLFIGQIRPATPEVLRIRVLQIIFDILMVHDRDFLGPDNANEEMIIEFLLKTLDQEESDKIQALLCTGIAKLMLAGFISKDKVLESLVLVYVSPQTAQNLELRQCLSYFFPVYCYSSPANQRRMQKSFITLFTRLSEVYREWDGDEDMISPLQTSLMFVDWTDPQKAAAIAERVPGYVPDESVHIDLACDIVKTLFDGELEREDKRILCQLLGKLYLPEKIDDDKIRTLKLLLNNLLSRRPLRDSVAKNAFVKFDATIAKKYEQQLADFNEDEYRQLEQLKELFEFLDDIIPEDDDDTTQTMKKRIGRKRRSGSVTTDTASSSGISADEGTPPRKSNGKGRAKRRRMSQSDDEDEDSSSTERASPPTARAPTRVMPRRSAADKSREAVSKSFAPPPEDSEDEEDEEDEEDSDDNTKATPVGSKRAPTSRLSLRAAHSDEGDDDLQDDSIMDQSGRLSKLSNDSIMDEDSDEEDAEEVDDLL